MLLKARATVDLQTEVEDLICSSAVYHLHLIVMQLQPVHHMTIISAGGDHWCMHFSC